MDAVLDLQCPLEFGTLPDCDCPYEHWHIGCCGACLDIHREPDGSIHVAIYDGDTEAETFLPKMSMECAREQAFAWAAPLIGERADREAP